MAGRAAVSASAATAVPCGLGAEIQDGRTLRLNPHDEDLIESRRAWRAGEFADDSRRWRPMVVRSIALGRGLGATARSATGAWPATSSGSPTAWRPSPAPPGQPGPPPRRRVEAPTVLMGSARSQGIEEGPLYGSCPPGWPASTLFVRSLRSDISPSSRPQPAPHPGGVQQSPGDPAALGCWDTPSEFLTWSLDRQPHAVRIGRIGSGRFSGPRVRRSCRTCWLRRRARPADRRSPTPGRA
jgi:hypothetical protein